MLIIKKIGNSIWIIIKYFFIAVLVCTFVIISSLFVAKLLKSYFNFELSSPFPTVATVFAIIVGFVVTIWQINHQREKIDKQSQQAYRLTFFAVYRVCDRLNNALNKEKDRVRDLQKDKTTQAINDIRNIAYMDLFDSLNNKAEVLDILYSIRIELTAINSGIDRFWDDKDKDKIKCNGDRYNKLKSSRRTIYQTKEIWKDLNKALQSSGIETLCFPEEKCMNVFSVCRRTPTS